MTRKMLNTGPGSHRNHSSLQLCKAATVATLFIYIGLHIFKKRDPIEPEQLQSRNKGKQQDIR